MTTQAILYLPVIHAGYERFLELCADRAATEILLLGTSVTDEYPELRKEIRALQPERAARLLNATGGLPPVRVAEADDLPEAVVAGTVLMPDEAVCRSVVREFGLAAHARVEYASTFLRWDRPWSNLGVPPHFDGRVSTDAAEVEFARRAHEASGRSSDWWRQVGAVAVRGGEILGGAHNRHLPHEYSPYLNGDPRGAYSRGTRMDLSTALHAEAALIAECARRGEPLDGADLFVSTFPCPSCARLVATAGFRRCFFSGGYSVLEGEEVLRARGVELVYVDPGAQNSGAPRAAVTASAS